MEGHRQELSKWRSLKFLVVDQAQLSSGWVEWCAMTAMRDHAGIIEAFTSASSPSNESTQPCPPRSWSHMTRAMAGLNRWRRAAGAQPLGRRFRNRQHAQSDSWTTKALVAFPNEQYPRIAGGLRLCLPAAAAQVARRADRSFYCSLALHRSTRGPPGQAQLEHRFAPLEVDRGEERGSGLSFMEDCATMSHYAMNAGNSLTKPAESANARRCRDGGIRLDAQPS